MEDSSPASREQGQFDVWFHDVDSGQARRLTFDVEVDPISPSWSSDGRHLYFTGGNELSKLDVRGDEAPRTIAEGNFPHLSSDGKYLVYRTLFQRPDLFYLELESASDPRMFVEGPATEGEPRISPDGSFVAYVSDESGRNELYVRRFPSGEGRSQISTDGARFPRWSADGTELFYLRGRELMAVPVSTRKSFEFDEPKMLFTMASPHIYEHAVTPDGQFVEVRPGEETSTIAVVDQWQSFFESANE